jgi:hypothetical protein
VHRTLAKLTSADVATYRDERLKDAAPATVVRELNTLSHAIETALREWGLWLPRNPVKMVRRPSVPQGRKRRLEDGEEERLLAACDRGRTPPLKQLVMGCNGLGSRCSNQKRIRGIFASPLCDLPLSPGTPSAHDNWRARDDSNTRTLPQEPPPHPNRAKSGPLPLTGVSSIEADRRP